MNKKLFNSLLIFSLVNLAIFPSDLSAHTTESQQSTREHSSIKFKQPKPPPDAPKVGRGRGGASRGKCSFTDSSAIALTPLLPASGWGLTASESPTLWIYVAYPSGKWEEETPLTAELSVEERKTDTKLKPKGYPFELPKTSGIFSITLPHSLEPNNWYRWYLVTNCQTANSSIGDGDVLQIEGVLQRRELNGLNHKTESLTRSQLVSLYAKDRLWYDTLHQSILLHCDNSSDNATKNYWQALLKSDAVNLDEVSDRSVFCSD